MANAYIHIPDELLEKIFLPQPVKSLVQWKCVCKLWNQVISRESFIKAHAVYQKSSENAHRYFLLNYRDPHWYILGINFPDFDQYQRGFCSSCYSACSCYYSASLVDRKSLNVLESYNDICCRESTKHCLEVYGICDGLLCLSIHDDLFDTNPPIFLYNPIIRKGKKLIPPIPDLTTRRGYYPGGIYDTSMCFGYHDDDYKVIKVNAFVHMYEVFIYSLNTDSWRFIKVEVADGTTNHDCFFDLWPYPKTKLLNGVAYFSKKYYVVSFDLRCEKIQKIQWPRDINFDNDVIMEEYGESIALIGSTTSHNRNTAGNAVVMLVLRRCENSYTWEKKFTLEAARNNELLPGFLYLPHYPAVQAMGGFINNNELVMRRWTSHDNGYIRREYFLYNVENGTHRQFQTPEERTGEAFLQRMNILTESLVLLTETTMPPIPSLEVARFACSCKTPKFCHPFQPKSCDSY